ncbi:hypothetical protein BJX99DRAFT_261681 [Aspergillus californicus]
MASKPAKSNLAKEREFYRYLPRDHTSYPFAPFDETGRKTFVPTPSRDHALQSFAQLGAIRLGAERAIISLFGPSHEYILAEATASPGLDGHDDLRLGCCILPKDHGICTDVVELPLSTPLDDSAATGDKVLLISDMKESDSPKQGNLAARVLNAQFYAGLPIVSPRGTTIGSYCVFDSQPRHSGLSEASVNFMEDMATTVMGYLDMMQSRYQNAQAKKMILGLGSFVEGKSTLRDSWPEANEQDAATGRSGETVEGQLNKQQQDLQEEDYQSSARQLPYRLSSRNSFRAKSASSTTPDAIDNNKNPDLKSTRATFRSSASEDRMPGHEIPAAFQKTFARAANLIREAIEVEGVAFIDARVESFGGLVGYEARENPDSASDDSSDSGSCGSGASNTSPSISSSEDDTTICRTLGSSTSKFSTINHEPSPAPKAGYEFAVRESVLKAILNRYPNGKIFNYNENGSLSDDSSSGVATTGTTRRTSRKRSQNHRQDAADLKRIFGGARSIIFMPLWDSHKLRWLSGVLVWTNSPERVFTADNDLAFLRAFGNSVMAEVHRFDVEMAERAKTNLVSSISHELRSPLHGILGTADILSDTAMNALQQGMVHTIESCGRTLLDTINNLLDFTYIDKFRKDDKPRHKHHHHSKKPKGLGQEQEKPAPDPPGTGDNGTTEVQLDAILEEVVESVFAGHSFYNRPRANIRKVDGAGSTQTIALPSKQVTIIFDVQEAARWNFVTQPGCWRRILLNIFSNALKYTKKGFIYLGLKLAEVHSDPSDKGGRLTVTLTVKDTGQGIGVEFLRNSLFTPFSQEDALAPGSGLGLSIVRKALGSLHGSIEVTSERDRGTEITIQAPLKLAPEPHAFEDSSLTAAYNLIRQRAEGKTMGLVGFGSSIESERDATLYDSLRRMCENWFHLIVKKVSLQGDTTPCDFYLMVHTDLDSPDAGSNQLLELDQPSKLSPLVVICQSPEFAHNMFARSMGRSQESIVEFISQPCGPRKLAKTLQLCIQREDGQGSDRAPHTRWVEVSESSQLPLDIGPRDAPDERMKISKRPKANSTDITASQDSDSSSEGRVDKLNSSAPTSTPAPVNLPVPERDSDNTRPSILLVEDNKLNLQILVAYVKKEGWDCITAKNGLEAVQKFQGNPGRFIMVIIDISMPVMDGFEASRKIRQFEKDYFDKSPDSKPSWHPTTIIASTGLDSADAQREAFSSGVNDFITKPVSRQKIQSLLQRCVI